MPLLELRHVHEIPGEPRRRIFLDNEMALTIWIDALGTPCGFELIYDRSTNPHAVIRRCGENKITHFSVDDGDSRPGKAKRTPVLGPPSREIPTDLLCRFNSISSALENSLVEFIGRELVGV